MSDDLTVRRSRSDFLADLLLVPNLISLGRIAGILVAAGLLFLRQYAAAFGVGLVAGLTDYLDGYLARRLNQTSQLGALLDSLADILVALVCLTVAVHVRVWPPYLLVAWGIRDMGVLALRASAGQLGFTIPTALVGKVSMNVTGYAYVFMAMDLMRPFGGTGPLVDGVHWVGLGAIHVGIALQWAAGILYVRAYAARYRRNPERRAVS